ncbi:hypothetical protein [Nocardia flavorosea]|uniref:hypothetical protein n=1 Tax=Nocardia flavorosea TaxID=53429 RepID=UPI000A79AE05|nr:hypothetical protein [Nocardia flavorosea]
MPFQVRATRGADGAGDAYRFRQGGPVVLGARSTTRVSAAHQLGGTVWPLLRAARTARALRDGERFTAPGGSARLPA